MTDMDLIKLAEEAGFLAAVLPAKEIPVDGSFRKFCEDNLCGKYNANYSCPPGCGTVEEVHQRLFAQEKALVVEMIWEVNGFDDKEFIFSSRNKLNRTVLQLMDQLREAGIPRPKPAARTGRIIMATPWHPPMADPLHGRARMFTP